MLSLFGPFIFDWISSPLNSAISILIIADCPKNTRAKIASRTRENVGALI